MQWSKLQAQLELYEVTDMDGTVARSELGYDLFDNLDFNPPGDDCIQLKRDQLKFEDQPCDEPFGALCEFLPISLHPSFMAFL